MAAAGVGSSSDSSCSDPCSVEEISWYDPARETSPLSDVAVWDPYMLPDMPMDFRAVPLVQSMATQVSVSMPGAEGSSDLAASQLLHILDSLDAKELLPVSVPFQLDLLTVQTCNASTLSYSLHACNVASDAVLSVGLQLWRTQHVTDEPDSFATQHAILSEGLQGKNVCYLITFFRRVLDDTASDLFHREILSLLKHLIPSSSLKKTWKRMILPSEGNPEA